MFRGADGQSHAFTFVLVTMLFLLWGFCNGLIDVLNKHFQNSLHISKAQSAMVQFSNYMGYFLMALPSGLLARRFGYKGGIIVGLTLIAIGAFWFIPATRIGTFPAFLTGLFILATGLTCLETVANPYATVLGPPEMAAARINLAQTCNGVGWILGPLVGGQFILSASGEVNRSNATLYMPYLGIGVVVMVLIGIFALANVPDIGGTAGPTQRTQPVERPADAPRSASIWHSPHFVGAIAAQFLYVAAQTGVFGFFINYLGSEMPALGAHAAAALPANWTFPAAEGFRLTERAAARLLSFGGFGLFLVGRFTGSLALRAFKPQTTLAIYGAVNVGAMLVVMAPLGWMSVTALFVSFFFMSIMFPTIFALGIHGLDAETKRASAFIVMAIVGGALVPFVMGLIADQASMRASFAVPLVCFAGVAAYGIAWKRLLSAGDGRGSPAQSARAPR
jgi:FHS family L-fucose permease-like MFS transporter